MSANKENLTGVINIAQTLLMRVKDMSLITPSLIQEKIKLAFAMDPSLAEGVEVSEVVEELIRRFSRWIGTDSTISDKKSEPWITAERKKEWKYWQRYATWLEQQISAPAVEKLDKTTDEILDLLADPKREAGFDRRGLVVGHVQSGKTSNYTALVAKAADAGYKLIIVLAGMHNNLRSQTQIRLEEGFLGYETSSNGDPANPIGVGVGNIDSDMKLSPACFTTRLEGGDFNTRVANHLANRPEERPWLFVVKKNKTVLNRLLKWIKNHVADVTDENKRKYVSKLPLLIIDDEADHASVDTGEQLHYTDGTVEKEYQPKAINSGIRRILNSFSKSSYVGYTATPFANIFIHRKNKTPEEGEDLFPSAFIKNLAAPSNYIGPSRVFGLHGTGDRHGGMPVIRPISYKDKAEELKWMPLKHKKDHYPLCDGEDRIPKSLENAVNSFFLTCAVRYLRGHKDKHSSMLIHVTRFNLVQDVVYRQVDKYVAHIKQRITRKIDNEKVISSLKDLWESDYVPTYAKFELIAAQDKYLELSKSLPKWEEVLEVLPRVLEDIGVKMINGTAKDALDYSTHSHTGLKVIAIGGDKLSRGLTLEGLCVSYFIRTSKMYDTLMQMGRWFGYRPGYVDVCRLYITDDLIGWFADITDAAEELREEFDLMVESGGSPLDYGLKVKSHPVLMVTSPLKMRTAEKLYLSFSGSLLQTISFFREKNKQLLNLSAANNLISAMGEPSTKGIKVERPGGKSETLKSSYLWKGVEPKKIIDFLSEYESHPTSTRVNSQMIANFVKKMAEANQLTHWNVVLMGEGSGREYVFESGLKIDSMKVRKHKGVEGRYSIGVLTDPSDEAVDLDADSWNAALVATMKAWKLDPARNNLVEPKIPSGVYIRKVKGFGYEGNAPVNTGLLILYPLDSSKEAVGDSMFEDAGYIAPVLGFAISFPSTLESEEGVKVEYQVDQLFWEEFGEAD
jgi:hypothetical protein